MNKIVCGAIILIIFSGGLTSCSFHRLVTRKKATSYDSGAVSKRGDTGLSAFPGVKLPTPDTTPAPIPDTSSAKKQLIKELTPLWEKRVSFKTFSGKAKVHFESPDDKQEFTANIRIKKDSIIWINVTAFGGLPAARILITLDSFFMTIPLKREAKRIALSQAMKILPTHVDFSSLQRLILGEPLRDGNIIDAAYFGGSWSLEVEDSNYIQSLTYNRADSTIRTAQLRTRNPMGPQTRSEFGSYETIGDHRVSTQRVVNIQNGNSAYMLDMNFIKFDFDEDLDYPFSIPSSYEVETK